MDYFDDYVLVLDETSELYAKYEFLDKNFEEQLQENLKLNLNEPTKNIPLLDELFSKILQTTVAS